MLKNSAVKGFGSIFPVYYPVRILVKLPRGCEPCIQLCRSFIRVSMKLAYLGRRLTCGRGGHGNRIYAN
uniref:Uncharacterized protein n=1 Tax=Solanum tuberosum TaxID=4113 RepID=M1CLN8_SOLTU